MWKVISVVCLTTLLGVIICSRAPAPTDDIKALIAEVDALHSSSAKRELDRLLKVNDGHPTNQQLHAFKSSINETSVKTEDKYFLLIALIGMFSFSSLITNFKSNSEI